MIGISGREEVKILKYKQNATHKAKLRKEG